MAALGAIPDIPVFEGERVPVSRNALTLGTRPLQLLPLPGSEFPVRHDTERCAVSRPRVVAAGFGDYATGLRRTEPRFPPAMRYALMERWNDCTHSFIFGFGEMTLTPADYTAITELGFDGAVWAYEYRIYPGGMGGDAAADARRIPRYLAHRHHTFSSSEDPHYWRCYLNDRTLADGMTPEDLLEEYDGSPADVHLTAGDYTSYFTTRLQARLSEVREYSQDRRRHRTPAYYRAQAEAEAEVNAPAGPTGALLGDVLFPSGMEVALDPALGLGSAIIIPADLRQAPPPLQLDPEHATHVPAQRYQELYQRFGFARSYIVRLYPELHERSRQSGAVARLQMEVDRLRTRLEVKGIPLDFSEDEEDDDDGSSSDDALPPLPSQAAAGSSRRRR
ncbi:hypothetical protein JCGZ_03607 [Jatropha curcas]|uniref:Aminotransferase-like plant mobile domain-containing protein n=1 Tax=Jatropha curcas TaxID=180498 RepID=A0A067JFN9_JATCU|nr:hypothetical protein JCGZ_03607 [Jatropha curcas]